MRVTFCVALILLHCSTADAQVVEMRPSGNWWASWPAFDSIYILAPVGSSVVNGAITIEYYANHTDTGSAWVKCSQDSLFGNRFKPEVIPSVQATLSFQNCCYTDNFSYSPKYEDTSAIRVSSLFQNGFTPEITVIGITYIAATNEYSLSRSTFDTLPSGDTELATLRLFNQTPDTELVSFSLASSEAFTFLDSMMQPFFLPPGDSVQPIRLRYLANVLRPTAIDSLSLSFQRVRGGSNYRSPIDFVIHLTGGCDTSYYQLSKTKFGYIATNDSSTGSLTLYNSTEDTESVQLSFNPPGDFIASQGMVSELILPPHDSSDAIQIVMHASINRKVIKDTLVIKAQWDTNSSETSILLFRPVLSGGCSDFRFSIDSILHPVYTEVGSSIVDPVTIHNLSDSTIIINGAKLSQDYFASRQYLYSVLIRPHQDFIDDINFQPLESGIYKAEQFYTDNYDSSADTGSITLKGIASASVVASSGKDASFPSIYPNPSTNEFRIEGMQSGSLFEIYDILGNPIFHSKIDQDVWKGQDDSGNLCRSGQYFAVVEMDSKRNLISLIISR